MNFLDYPTQKPKRTLGPFGIVAVVLLLLLGMTSLQLPDHASAIGGTRTWDGGGIDNNWSTCANWSGDGCPASSDNVVFDATSTKNATVDASFAGTVNAYTINTGYTGTVTMARSLTVNAGYTQVTGTFTAANQALSAASFTLSGGTFTASSGTTTVSGALTISGSPTFNANSGTFAFTGAAGTLACNNVTFNLVTINATNSKTINSDCNLPLGSNPSVSLTTGTITLNGTLSGSGTFNKTGGGTLLINGAGALSGFSGIVTAGTITVDAATLNLGSYTTVDFNGALNVQNGATFTAPSGTATFASAFVLASGTTFNANGGNIIFDGTITASISCNGATFNTVSIKHSAGTKTVDSTCSLPLGNNPVIGVDGTARLSLDGTLTGSGKLTIGTAAIPISLLTVGGGSNLTGFSGLKIYGGLTVNGTYSFANYTSFDIDGTLIVGASGIVTGPTGNENLANFTNNGGTFNANGGTTIIDGDSSEINCASGTSTFTAVTLAGTGMANLGTCNLPLGSNPTVSSGIANNGTLSGSGTLTINGNFTAHSVGSLSGFNRLVVNGDFFSAGGNVNLSSYALADFNGYFWTSGGTFIAPANAPMYVSGSLFNSYNTDFTANGGTVVLDGTNQLFYSSFTFYNLTKQVSAADTVTFTAGKTQTVLNKLTLKGQPLQLLSLVSTNASTWGVDLRGTADVCSVDVTKSNSIGNEITAYSSFSNSANLGWVFNDANCPSSGGGGGSGGVIEPTTAVTNFQFTQAAATANAASDKQVSLVLGATDQRLRSPISSVFGKIPKGSAIVNSILGFFAVCVVIAFAAGLGFWWLVAWRRRYNQDHWYIHTRTNQDIF